jgi:SEC-C motif-containing protein
MSESLCPCGSKKPYAECCQPFHQGEAFPATAEQLMRSRYSAYALHLKDYLLQTWDKTTRPGDFSFESGLKWCKLRIVKTKQGGAQDGKGMVAFRAEYELDTESGVEKGVMTEKSQFRRDDEGHWVYVSGEVS